VGLYKRKLQNAGGGSCYVVVVPTSVVRAWGIHAGDYLLLREDGRKLIIEPLPAEGEKERR